MTTALKKAPADHTIQLQNPVADHFPTFIAGNAVSWQSDALVMLQELMPPADYDVIVRAFEEHRVGYVYSMCEEFRDAVAKYLPGYFMVQQGEAAGKNVVICGAGPSLRHHAVAHCPDADQVWGCNSAAMYLHNRGIRVTHGFTVDQTPQMVSEWAGAPDLEYLLATTAHPNLTDLLRSRGRRRRFFHNFVGIRRPPVHWPDSNGVTRAMSYEDWMYATLFPITIRTGAGLNSVTRAIELAQYMGFASITVLGADCCIKVKGKPRHDLRFGSPQHLKWLRKHTVMHADGGHALSSGATALTLSATIDGRYWMTKTDMVISAQWLVRMARASNGRIRLIGDTLPNALMHKDESFMRRLPNFVDSEGRIANLPVFDEHGVSSEAERVHPEASRATV